MPAEREHRAALAHKSTYASMDEFKKAVTDYALAQHFPHKWAASKTDWAVAVCQRNKACDFRARVNHNTALQLYEVTVFREGHVCAGLGDPKPTEHGRQTNTA
ncbi:hypothetical protein CF336_g6010 [Tilletia laevis]|nr:hypothetical protein CF336_g6010 [Tilletia laevis]KAE8190747.1 hypothetical protein CF328_g5880 [Tilletia controversa]